MNFLFTYDSEELQNIGQIFLCIDREQQIHVQTARNGARKCLFDVAEEIQNKLQQEGDIVFINQFLACADEKFEWLQCNSGIALIKFLRMMDVQQHIVLITPYTESQLVYENPGNLIVTTKGISLVPYLHDIRNMSIAELKTKFSEVFDIKQDLNPYILSEFHIPEDERHNWANWWGIDRLWNVHCALEQDKMGIVARQKLPEYPDELRRLQKELRNRQALFLFGFKDERVSSCIDQFYRKQSLTEARLEILNSALQLFINNQEQILSEIEAGNESSEKMENVITKMKDMLPQSNGLSFENLNGQRLNFESWVVLERKKRDLEMNLALEKQRTRHIKYSIGKLELELKELYQTIKIEKRRLIEQLSFFRKDLEQGIKEEKSKIRGISLSILRNELTTRRPTILYIDDQSDLGWSTIFQRIIYGEPNNRKFNAEIVPNESDLIDQEYCNKIMFQKIREQNPDLILLDLRLQKESGVQLDIEKLSGAIVLKWIRERFPGIPVLMTTASNKAWTFEQLQGFGVDAYWMKEGIDQHMSETDSVKNYIRFVELVNILTDTHYAFLKKFANNINDLMRKDSHWWQTPRWLNARTDTYISNLKVEKQIVQNILSDTVVIVRDFLRLQVTKNVYGTVLNGWLYPSLIIINLAKIIEHIHGITQSGIPTVKYIQNSRGDHLAADLLHTRATAAHFAYSHKVDFEMAMKYCADVIQYLSVRPDFRIGLTVIGKIDLG